MSGKLAATGAKMASLRTLRSHDLWDHGSRVRYGSKGRLSSTMVLGDPGQANVFVPITLSPAETGRRYVASPLQRRRVGGAEVATVPWRSASDGSITPGEGSFSLGHTLGVVAPCNEGDPSYLKPLKWYAEPGLQNAQPPATVNQRTYVDHSGQWDIAKPAKTQVELTRDMLAKQVAAGSGPFTATTTQRVSFVSHSGHRDHVWAQAGGASRARTSGLEQKGSREKASAPRALTATGQGKDRQELTSSGCLRGWTPEEMACARGRATFTAEHKTAEPMLDHRPTKLGRNLHYYLEE